MSFSQEQIARQQQSTIETSIALIEVALDSAERLFSLNLAITRAVLEHQSRHSRDVFAVTDPRELLALQAAYLAPLLGHGLGYVRATCGIAAEAGVETGKIVENHLHVVRRGVGGFVDRLTRAAPGGLGSAAKALQSTAVLFGRLLDLVGGTMRRGMPGAGGLTTPANIADAEAIRALLIEHKKAA